MPKPMTMTIAIEEIAFGSVFRRLKNMEGVISLDIHDDNEKPKSNGKGRGGGGIAKQPKGTDAGKDSAKCIVLNYIDQAKRPCPSGELTLRLVEAGKSPKTFANVSHIMKRDKLARKTKKGWVLSPTGRKYLNTECRVAKE